MYESIDESDSATLLVEERDGKVIGFVTGANGMGPIYIGMLRRWFYLVPALLPSLCYPRRLWRILEILRYSRKGASQADLPAYELLSIAVDPDARGGAISERLYTGLMANCRERNIPAFKIVVGVNLALAHRFYGRMGAVVVAETEVHQGQRSLVYVQNVT